MVELYLENTNITGEGVQKISQIKFVSLKKLNISMNENKVDGNQIGDKGKKLALEMQKKKGLFLSF